MTSSNILLVIVLCITFCSIPTVMSKDDETMTDSVFIQIPGLDILKQVEIRKDGQITSLSEMFGPNPAEWSVDGGNFRAITNTCLTAQLCVYTSQIMSFLQTIENDIAKCEEIRNEMPTKKRDKSWDVLNSFIECLDKNKLKFKSWLPITLKMLATTMNYTKKFNISADKNALNAIMSFYLFVNDIQKRKSEYSTELQQNQIELEFPESFFKMRLYARNLIESFAVWNCSWTAFDEDLSNKIQHSDSTIVNNFSLPQKYIKREHFKPKILFLANVSDIRLDPKDEYSTLGAIRVLDLHDGFLLRDRYLEHVSKDNHEQSFSENITKSQTIVFESIAMTMFYLIRQIIQDSIQNGITLLPHIDNIVNNAIHILSRFNFPGFLHVKLRNVIYHRIFSTNHKRALNTIFECSQIEDSQISDRVIKTSDYRSLKKVIRFATILDRLTKNIEAMESEIKAVSEINKNLCDYEYEELGFLQYDTSKYNGRYGFSSGDVEKAYPIMVSLKKKNCQFSTVAVVHFILNDFIISQCELITLGTNNLHMVKQLKSCFDSLINSIVSIGETLDYSLNTILKKLDLTKPYNNGNRKLIDSILSMKLYFSNVNMLNSDVPLTEEGSVDKNGVTSKLETLKQSHRFIINLIESYTINRCPTPSTREEFTETTNTQLHGNCSHFMNSKEKTQIIECVKRLTVENLKNYVTDETQMDRKDFTVDSLLMNTIINKALIAESSFSMLYDLQISWDGHYRGIWEIVDFVKNNINPKYLSRYQLTIIKAMVFIAYEYMKTIIETSDVGNNFLLYSDNKNEILTALNFVLVSDYFPERIFHVYATILEYFDEYFSGAYSFKKQNPLIHVIEIEQYYLGMQKEPSDVNEDDIVLSLPDHILKMTSAVETVDQSSSKMVVGIDDGQKIIDRLLAYSSDIQDIFPSLLDILGLLALKEVTDITIQ